MTQSLDLPRSKLHRNVTINSNIRLFVDLWLIQIHTTEFLKFKIHTLVLSGLSFQYLQLRVYTSWLSLLFQQLYQVNLLDLDLK